MGLSQESNVGLTIEKINQCKSGIKRTNEKSHVVTLIDAEIALKKIQQPFMIIKEHFLHLVKNIYKTPTAVFILNGELL